MGLCKCPKKKVTNLFCFEHRVNVCEHCLVANHPKCVVKSYLQWLQDSDYDPNCRLCGKALRDETEGPCGRLICYDVFHWSCLDAYARRLPANTAPAGYCCPVCKAGIFPPSNLVSPVSDTLKQLLSSVNWARAGLGMPLIDEPESRNRTSVGESSSLLSDIPSPVAHGDGQVPPSVNGGGAVPALPSHSVISMDDATLYARTTDKSTEQSPDPRKVFDSREQRSLNLTHDHDDDKYKRRSALQWFSRWFSSRTTKQRADPNAAMKRCAVIMVVAVLAFLTVLVIFTRVGRASADKDPFLDPLANPNIRIQDSN